MKSLPLLFIFTFVFLNACNAQETSYDAWDTNGDGLVADEEFHRTFDENEYFNDWDTDGDGQLDDEEWSEGFSSYYEEPYDKGFFEDWDLDEDGYINEDEYVDNTFDMWDQNDDNYINNQEYITHNKKEMF